MADYQNRAHQANTLQDWRDAAERAGYRTVDRAAGGFNVRSDACHDGGTDPTGVWVVPSENGYPQAHCDNHPFPESDRNFRERVGLPAFKRRNAPIEGGEALGRVIATYHRASTGRPRNVYRLECGPGCQYRNCPGDADKHVWQDKHGRLDGYLPATWTPRVLIGDLPPVWVDGEKAAAAVRDAGATAISTIGGHGNAIKAAWASVEPGAESMLVWPDNTAGEVEAANALAQHLCGLGYAVAVLPPVGEAGSKADAADLPGPEAILAHLRMEPVQNYDPNAIPDPSDGEVLSGATFRTDAAGFKAAILALGLEIRGNARAGDRIEWRRQDWDADSGRAWAAAMWLRPDGRGWWPAVDRVDQWIQDSMAARLRMASGNGLRFAVERWRHVVLATIAERMADPVRDWLADLPTWDEKPRVDTLFTDALGAENTPLTRNAARGLLIGAMARTFEPGCLHDWIPVLIGRQGCGKSSFCKFLLPPEYRLSWYSDSVNLDDPEQKQLEQVGNALLVEYAEMRGAMVARRDALKSHITRQKTNGRPAYGQHTREFLHAFVGIGTANDTGTGVLPYDPSGHRRYVVVRTPCDCDRDGKPKSQPCDCEQPARMRQYLDANRLQLWAEALAKYNATSPEERNHLHLIDRRLAKMQRVTNEDFTVQNQVLADMVANLRSEDSGQPIAELMVRAGLAEDVRAGSDRRRQNDFAEALTAANWYKRRVQVAGKQAIRWYAPEPELLSANCALCGEDNDGRSLMPSGLCARCGVKEGATMLAAPILLERVVGTHSSELAAAPAYLLKSAVEQLLDAEQWRMANPPEVAIMDGLGGEFEEMDKRAERGDLAWNAPDPDATPGEPVDIEDWHAAGPPEVK